MNQGQEKNKRERKCVNIGLKKIPRTFKYRAVGDGNITWVIEEEEEEEGKRKRGPGRKKEREVKPLAEWDTPWVQSGSKNSGSIRAKDLSRKGEVTWSRFPEHIYTGKLKFGSRAVGTRSIFFPPPPSAHRKRNFLCPAKNICCFLSAATLFAFWHLVTFCTLYYNFSLWYYLPTKIEMAHFAHGLD